MPTSQIVGIIGSGVYFPKKKITVKELADKYHLNYKTLLADHGIKQVHIANAKENEFYMARKSIEHSLKEAKLSPEEIDLVIYCKGITRQKSARTFSSRMIQHIGAQDAYGFDIDAGFMGGLIGIQVANDIIKTNYHMNNAIVVGAQEFDELYLFGGKESRIGNMIFGDGAASVILRNDAEKNNILSSNFVIDHYTSLIDELFVGVQKDESPIKKVLKKLKRSAVVKKIRTSRITSNLTRRWVDNAYDAIEFCMRSVNLDIRDIDHFVKTQLSRRETEELARRLNVPKDMIFNASEEKGHLGHVDILHNLHAILKYRKLMNLDIIALVASNYDCSSGALIIRR